MHGLLFVFARIPCSLLLSIALVLMYYANSLPAYLIVRGVLPGTGHNIYSLPVDTAISNWFVRFRGKAHVLQYLNTFSAEESPHEISP